MTLFARKKRQPQTESEEEMRRRAMALRPQRLLDWQSEPDGSVIILKPKVANPRLARYLSHWLKNPFYRVHLDEVGSFVWRRCDGRHTVEQILGEMRTEFGDSVEPAFERLTLFLARLYRGKFIRYV